MSEINNIKTFLFDLLDINYNINNNGIIYNKIR